MQLQIDVSAHHDAGETNYLTQGIDGVKRLRTGPDIASYRGLSIVHSRCFSMEPGTPPRDILQRRVRVAEYYWITPNKDNWKREFHFYNGERDTWFTYSFKDLLEASKYNVANDGRPGYHNHKRITAAVNHLAGKAPDGQQHQALGAGAGLGAEVGPALGLQVDHLQDHTQRSLLSKVVVAATDSTWANWAPAGDFITEDTIFAIGAMTWNRFYQKVNKVATNPGGRNFGDDVYIPPDKFYFNTILNSSRLRREEDGDMDANGLAYGSNLCKAYRKALTEAENPDVQRIGGYADDFYPRALVTDGYFRAPNGGVNDNDRYDLAIREQCKVATAILFEAVCEYPRVIDDFYSNASAENFYVLPIVQNKFRLGSENDPNFCASIRFRNWMLYGVAHGLINNRRRTAAGASVPFGDALKCMERGTNCFSSARDAPVPVGADPTYPTTFLPWNKVKGSSSVIPNHRDRPDHPDNVNEGMYSLFDISKGSRSNLASRGQIPGDIAGGPSWRSTSMFGESLDDGLAFLREPGAFLSPNHFHPSNDHYEYSTVGSFIGANVILTREMLSALLMHNRAGGSNGASFLENTLLFLVLSNFNLLSSAHVDVLFGHLKRCHEHIDAVRNPPPAAPPAAGAVGPPPAVPAPPVLDRISITSSFIAAAGANPANDLVSCLRSIANDLGYTNNHTRLNSTWTWPYVSNSID